MLKKCPNSDKCPMYKHFQLKEARDIFIQQYCEGNFNRCKRKQLKDSGEPVPEKLLPDGDYL